GLLCFVLMQVFGKMEADRKVDADESPGGLAIVEKHAPAAPVNIVKAPEEAVTHAPLYNKAPEKAVTHAPLNNKAPEKAVTHAPLNNKAPEKAVTHAPLNNKAPERAVTHASLNNNGAGAVKETARNGAGEGLRRLRQCLKLIEFRHWPMQLKVDLKDDHIWIRAMDSSNGHQHATHSAKATLTIL